MSNELSIPERIEQLYAEGCSDVEVMAELRISKQKFDLMYATDEDFKELIDAGRLASSAYWHSVGRKNLFNKNLNTNLWMFVMKNRFGWAERQENIGADTPPNVDSVEDLQAKVLAKLPGIVRRLGVELKDAELLDLEKKNVSKS